MSFMISIPALTDIVLKIFDDDESKAGLWLAGLNAMINLIAFFTNPFYGVLADHFGRKPFLLIGELSLGFYLVFVAVWQSLEALIIGGIIWAVLSAMASTGSAVVTDLCESDEKLAKNFGKLGAWVAASFIVGIGIGSGLLWLDDEKTWIPFLVGAAVEGVNLLYTSSVVWTSFFFFFFLRFLFQSTDLHRVVFAVVLIGFPYLALFLFSLLCLLLY